MLELNWSVEFLQHDREKKEEKKRSSPTFRSRFISFVITGCLWVCVLGVNVWVWMIMWSWGSNVLRADLLSRSSSDWHGDKQFGCAWSWCARLRLCLQLNCDQMCSRWENDQRSSPSDRCWPPMFSV